MEIRKIYNAFVFSAGIFKSFVCAAVGPGNVGDYHIGAVNHPFVAGGDGKFGWNAFQRGIDGQVIELCARHLINFSLVSGGNIRSDQCNFAVDTPFLYLLADMGAYSIKIAVPSAIKGR